MARQLPRLAKQCAQEAYYDQFVTRGHEKMSGSRATIRFYHEQFHPGTNELMYQFYDAIAGTEEVVHVLKKPPTAKNDLTGLHEQIDHYEMLVRFDE